MRLSNGLQVFSKTNDRRRLLLAAFHSPHSLTWRWTVSFGLYPSGRLWPLFKSYRTNDGLQWWARVPFLGVLDFHQQRPMWFRDLYRRARDRQDKLDGKLWQRGDPVPAPPVPNATHEGSHFVQ